MPTKLGNRIPKRKGANGHAYRAAGTVDESRS